MSSTIFPALPDRKRRKWDETGAGDPHTIDSPIPRLQLLKRIVEEIIEFGRWIFGQVSFHKPGGLGIVGLLRSTVGVTAARMTPEVAIEKRANVPKFMYKGRHFFLKL
jgi:hypothetical protein